MERDARELGCQMSHCHLLHNHINSHGHICSASPFGSINSPEYGYWLSSMAYANELFSHGPYEHCFPRQCLNRESTASLRHLSVSNGVRNLCTDRGEAEAWPTSPLLPAQGCRLGHHESNRMHNFEFCSSHSNNILRGTYMHDFHEVRSQVYADSTHGETVFELSRHRMLRRRNSIWKSQIKSIETRNDVLPENDVNFEDTEADGMQYYSDLNITSTLCGLEEVLTRLIWNLN